MRDCVSLLILLEFNSPCQYASCGRRHRIRRLDLTSSNTVYLRCRVNSALERGRCKAPTEVRSIFPVAGKMSALTSGMVSGEYTGASRCAEFFLTLSLPPRGARGTNWSGGALIPIAEQGAMFFSPRPSGENCTNYVPSVTTSGRLLCRV